MALSNDLISQFVKATQDKETTKKESTAYGKIVKKGDVEYVQLDGSDLLTPITATTVVKDGDRVIVTIKNHTAIVTGDFTNPSANNEDIKELGTKISEFEIIIADKVSTEQLEAEIAKIDQLVAGDLSAINAEIETINGKVAEIDTIKADVVEVEEKITAHEGEFTTIRGEIAEFENVTTEQIEAISGEFRTLESDYADFEVTTTNRLTANEASITELETKKLDAESAKITYANIDFSNIGEAAVQKLFTDSGIIKDLIMSDGKVTGELVGVTIKGDLIEGNTVKADKLVILGEDGIYYKLNVDALGSAKASSDEKYQNGLDGSVILAQSITADRVAVTDLVAFGATIGGYHIDTNSLYSGVKNSVDNDTNGIFLGDDGQMAIGNAENFLKFFVDENGQYKLEIQASEIKIGASNASVADALEELKVTIDGITNQHVQKGGNNIFYYDIDFWKTNTVFNIKEEIGEIRTNSVSGMGYIVNEGSSYQTVEGLENGTYTVSFKYKKIGPELSNISVKINDDEYSLTETEWTEFVKTIEVNANYITIELISDTDNALYFTDLLGNLGSVKDTWTQNPNETRTDTVTIGKGIKVESTASNTYTKIDADGTRVFNINDEDEIDPVAKFTENGIDVKDIEVRGQSEISGLLIKQVENQTWISSLL